jgi:hypothetical protein
MYKFLRDKYDIDFTWVDLDTVFVDNIEYINDLSSTFIDTGGNNKDPHLLMTNTQIYIPRDTWIQGNFWKINEDLYNKVMKINNDMNSKGHYFCYDLQSLFTYYLYFILNPNEWEKHGIYVLGRNYKENVINGLAIWSINGNTHANLNGLTNLYHKNGKIKSAFYPDKEIHLLSFTFYTLNQLIHTNKFKELFLLIGSNQ